MLKRDFGPSTGYQSAAKKAWRDEVWWHISRLTDIKKRAQLSVFMIESLDGLEIEKAKKLGFSEGNMHVCNANPAVVATLKRKYPLINTYGVDAGEALRRALKNHVELDVVSLDLCCCTCQSALIATRSAGVGAAWWGRPFLFAINRMRGRESATVQKTLSTYNDRPASNFYRPHLRDRASSLTQLDSARHTVILDELLTGTEAIFKGKGLEKSHVAASNSWTIEEFGKYNGKRVTLGWEIYSFNLAQALMISKRMQQSGLA